MKKVIAILVCLLTFGLASVVVASEDAASNVMVAEETESFGVVLTSELWSDNVDSQGYYYPGPILETNFFLGLPKGFYLNVWNRWGTRVSSSDELDYGFGWAGEWLGLEWDATVTYWDLWNLLDSGGPAEDIWNLSLVVGKSFLLSDNQEAFLYVDLDQVIPVDGGDGGAYAELGIEYSLSGLLISGLNLSVNPWILWDSGVYDGEATAIVGVKAGLEYQVNNNFVVILPGFTATSPLQGGTLEDGRQSELVFRLIGIGISF